MPALPITTSPDITSLNFGILYDISAGTPSITLTNLSVGNPSGSTRLNNCTWWYKIYSPNGVAIHEGSESTPDVDNNTWSTLTIPAGSWPTPFGIPPYGQVEFSCAVPYVATLFVKDGVGNIYSTAPKSTLLCRPNGNTDKTKGNFGAAEVGMQTQCAQAKIYSSDTTNYTYQGIIGSSQASTWTLAYPMDADGNLPDPVVVLNKPTVIFPVGYSSEGYQLYLNTFCTYNTGDNGAVKIQYKFKEVFSVFCNVDLCAIQCEIDKLYAQLSPKCGTVTNPELQDRLFRIGVLMDKCLTGIAQPLCGIDVPATIQEIKRIGCFDCDCMCGTGGGINPVGNTTGIITFDTETVGDITAVITNVGDNYLLHLEVPNSGGVPNLQQVSQVGNVTNRPLYSGVQASYYSSIASRNVNVANGADILIALDSSTGTNYLRIKGATSGIVQLTAADVTTPYTMKLPAAQGTGYLKNPGDGLLVWDASGGGGSQNLQQVTTVGNETTNPINLKGAGTKLMQLTSGGFAVYQSTGDLWAGLDTSLGIARFILRGGAAGTGTVNMQAPSAISASYDWIFPAAQGGANTLPLNDGTGQLSWWLANLQNVTNNGSITTNTITVGASAGSNAKLSATDVTVYNASVVVARLLGVGGIGILTLREFTGFIVNLRADPGGMTSNLDFFFPRFKSGTLALSGAGTAVTFALNVGAGTGATVVDNLSNDNGGSFTITTGTSPAVGRVILVSYSMTYPTTPYRHVVICPGNAATAALSGAQNVYANEGSLNSFEIISGATPLAASTVYRWNYVVSN